MKAAAIVLAAGRGKRMKSALPKVLHPLAGKTVLAHVLDLVKALAFEPAFVIVGHEAEAVASAASERGIATLLQDPPRGTGDAVLQARAALQDYRGPVLILNGDTPLLREETIRDLLAAHRKHGATLSLLTVNLHDPGGYGRVIRRDDGSLDRVVEYRDADAEERKVKEINTGVYICEAAFLFKALDRIQPNNDQQEYYLTDIIGIASREGAKCIGLEADPGEVIGINSRADLALAEAALRSRINQAWMEKGVTLLDPARIRIDVGVTIGADTLIHPGVSLEGTCQIGSQVVVYPSRIKDSRIGKRVTIKDYCVIEEAEIEADATVGPFAHLRPGSVLRKGAKVGNFVEMKKTVLGEGSKASHLSYLGDAIIGKGVNIGAGTITCNYDGHKKDQTLIEDKVFIGSDSQLVAPVKVGRGALIAAGTTVTKDVPADALAISRSPQENIVGWAKTRRAQKKKKA